MTDPTASTETTPALARTDNTVVPLDRVPFTWKTLHAIAKTEFVPRALRGKPNALLAAVLTGREMGLGPMESMRSIDVIDGRPSPSVEWMVGRILEAGHLIYTSEQTPETCTVKGVRFVTTPGGEQREIEQSFTFTMDMARRVKVKEGKTLADKANWRNYPEAMLYWRAASQLARQLFPDILRSVKHNPDELGADDIHPYGVVDLPEMPEDLAEMEATAEPVTDTDDFIEDAEAEEIDEDAPDDHIWRPTPTGEDDKVAIARARQYADAVDLWTDLSDVLGTWETWVDKTMPETQAELRFMFRAMECLGVWEGNDTLHEELKRVGRAHLAELRKDELTKFVRNMVTKAQMAVRDAE